MVGRSQRLRQLAIQNASNQSRSMAFGRTNSLSLNTGAVNSSLYVVPPSPHHPDPMQAYPSNPRRLKPNGILPFPDTPIDECVIPLLRQDWTPPENPSLLPTPPQTPPSISNNNNNNKRGLGPHLLTIDFSAAQQNQQNQQQQSSQPAAGTSLFGGATGGSNMFSNNNTQTSQPAASGGLFGGAQNTQTSQPGAGSSLFGGSLFGSNQQNQNQNQNTQQNTGSSLFGNQFSQPAAGGSSLFGGQQNRNQNQNQQQQTGSMFGNATQNQNQNSGSLFGSLNQSQQQQQQPQQPTNPSLLSASRYHQSSTPFTGRLSMGQGSAPQPTSTAATKLDWQNVRPTTRYNDLVDSAKSQLEEVDKMIQMQEGYCRQIEAILPKHGGDVASLVPDIDIIKNMCDEAEQSLVTDAQGVQGNKDITQNDANDVLRLERIIENLRLPPQYHYAPASGMYGSNAGRQSNAVSTDVAQGSSYDVDLVNNFFTPLSEDLRRLIMTYNSNLSEIENHMQTIEASAVSQAQQLAQQRMSGSAGQVGVDSVRQLADTLRGFESSILGVASKVGDCREGVNEMAMGRLSASQAGRRAW